MFKGLGQKFLQKRYAKDQKSHEELLNIISHQRNADENFSEIVFHAHQDDNNPKYGKQQVLVRMQRS